MAENLNILVGTVGQGIIRSRDDGKTWQRVGIGAGLHSDALVRCITNHPSQPQVVFIGTERGLYQSRDAGQSWRFLDSPMNGTCVWSLAIDPTDTHIMYAGTGTPNPATIFRSTDSGKTWDRRPVVVAAECPAVGVPRVTGIAIDPENPQDIWAGFEVDGVRHSMDGGETWERLDSEAIPNPDVHNVAIAPGPPKTVVVLVNDDVFMSADGGAKWRSVGVRQNFPLGYPRGVLVQPGNPKTIFVTLGDTTPGSTGTIMRSRDTGRTWQNLTLPVQPNTAMWVIHSQPFAPNTLLAGSRYGYLYRSDDGGDSWVKLWREVSEVSSILWIPN
ncbi:MAG: hypothetical protein FJ316_00110 [SAR202 cluster bacterium]|nr:hypothetical protein [SAR202 cluster bacterium]